MVQAANTNDVTNIDEIKIKNVMDFFIKLPPEFNILKTAEPFASIANTYYIHLCRVNL